MSYKCTEEQWSKHPRHDKYQSRLHADLALVRQSTCIVGGDWLEDSGDVKETSSLVKTKVQSKIMDLRRVAYGNEHRDPRPVILATVCGLEEPQEKVSEDRASRCGGTEYREELFAICPIYPTRQQRSS